MALKYNSDYVWTGLDTILFDDRDTGLNVCSIETGVDFELSDELQVDYVRGSVGNKKLIQLTGDRDTTVTFNVATITNDLMKLKTNSTIERKTVEKKMVEKLFVSDSTVTLAEIPKAKTVITVKAVNSKGEESEPLVVGTPASNEGEYSISEKVITVHSSITKVNVYYTTDKEMDVNDISDITPKNYKITALLIGKTRGGDIITGQMTIPNGAVTPSYTYGASNDGSVPDAVAIQIDALEDSYAGYPIRIATDIAV